MRDIDVAWIVAFLKQKQVENKSQLIQIFQDFLNIPVGAWKATRFLAGWKAWGVLLQEKFICCSRNCTKSLGEGIYGIWGTFVAKDGHEWLPKSSKFAATLKPRHQGDAGPISLQDKGEKMLRIGSILTPKSRSDPENIRKHWQSKVCESTLHRRNPIW